MSRYFRLYVAFSLLCAVLVVVRPLSFLSDDGLFYLVIARHIASGHGSTFNGLFPTNGYHPLWEGVASVLALLAPSKLALLKLGIFAQWAMASATLFILLKALQPRLQTASLGAFCAVMLFFFVPFSNLFWSEAPLSMLFVAAAFYLLLSPNPIPYVVLGVVLGLAFLSRLDNIFFIACVFVGLWWRDRNVRLGIAWLVCAAIASGYLLTNQVYFGHTMPISGAIKSAVYRQHYFSGQLGPYGILSLFGAVGLVVKNLVHRSSPRDYRIACLILAAGVILHAAYVWALTYGDTVWVWYYVQGYLCLALLAAQCIESLKLPNAFRWGRALFVVSLSVSAAIAVAKFSFNWSWHDHRATAGHWRDDWIEELERVLPKDDSVLVVLDLPGMFAYGTSHPVFALDGLTMNYHLDEVIAKDGMAVQLQRFHTPYFLGPVLIPGDVYRTPFISQYGVAGGQIVHFFTPLRGTDAGCIRIDNASLVTEKQLPHALLEGDWGIWRLTPEALKPVTCPVDTGRVDIRSIRS